MKDVNKFSTFTHYKIILLLAMFYLIIDCACNVVLYKIAQVGIFTVPAGIFIYPIVFLIADIIAEVYGYRLAQLIILYDLLLNLFFAIVVELLIQLPSPQNWHLEGAYKLVLNGLLRANLSVIISVLAGNVLNIYFLSRWKVIMQGNYFWLRSIGASMVGEATMLILFAFIFYAGRLPLREILQIIPSDYFIRVLYAIVGAYPASMVVAYLKKYGESEIEGSSNSLNVNPFAKVARVS